MEWVETRGKSIELAKESALDQLGVDESEAEFEVVEEAKSGLFGISRREARVRARVRPAQPRPKAERRDRRKRGGERGRSEGGSSKKGKDRGSSSGGRQPAKNGSGDGGGSSSGNGGGSEAGTGQRRRRRSRGRGSRSGEGAPSLDVEERSTRKEEGTTMSPEITLDIETQGEIVADFMDGVVGSFDLDGDIVTVPVDEETVEVRVDGDDLGLLIGPKGQTLAALQELARTVVYRRADGPTGGRVRLDVSGYRQKRREALEQFAATVAEQVKESGSEKALEPMGAPDRKIVHDAINAIDGVVTVSEGEDPRRRVVIRPAE